MELFIKEGDTYTPVETLATRVQKSLHSDYERIQFELEAIVASDLSVSTDYDFLMAQEEFLIIDDMCTCVNMTIERVETFYVMLKSFRDKLCFLEEWQDKHELLERIYSMYEKTDKLKLLLKTQPIYMKII